MTEKQRRLALAFSIFWLIMIAWLAFFWHLGSIGLVDKTEPMFVEASRQMTVTGDWITPYWNGETRFDKPPLIYWTQAIAFKLLGVNELAARLPSAIAAIALTVLGFYTLRYFGPTNAKADIDNTKKERQLWISAWLGSALIALNPAIIAWGRTGVSDMLLAANISMALLCFFIGYAQPDKVKQTGFLPPVQQRWYLAFYVLVALAILAKGPVGLVLPVLIIATFLLYIGKFREVGREMRPVVGSLIIAAIALPWFVLVTLANGKAYIDTFFGLHNVERFTSVVSNHAGPWYFYFPVVLVGLAPWSIYLPLAIARLRFWQRDIWMRSPRTAHLGLFTLFWFVGVLGFFSIAVTKLPSYVLPLMPAGAILVALFWTEQINHQGENKYRSSKIQTINTKQADRGLLISGVVNVIVLLALAIGSFYSPKLIGYDPLVPNLSQILQQSGLPIWAGTIWGAAAIAAVVLLLRSHRWRWLWSPNLAAFMAFLIFVVTPGALLMDVERQLPLRQLSATASQVVLPGEEMLMVGFIRPSVVFYTQRTVNFLDQKENAVSYLKALATKPAHSSSVLILAEPNKLDDFKRQPYKYRELDKVGPYQLVRVFLPVR